MNYEDRIDRISIWGKTVGVKCPLTVATLIYAWKEECSRSYHTLNNSMTMTVPIALQKWPMGKSLLL